MVESLILEEGLWLMRVFKDKELIEITETKVFNI